MQVDGADPAIGPKRGRSSAAPRTRKRTSYLGYLYLLPALALYGGFVVRPLIQGVWLSLYNWDGFTAAKWVGFGNYVNVLKDPEIRGAFAHSLVMLLFYSVLPMLLALLVVFVLSGRRVRGATTFRAVLFLPQILPSVAIGIIWRWVYAPDGPLNGGLSALGLGGLARGWLGDFTWALPAVGSIGTWVTFGFVMVLLLSGVQRIPRELRDAARIDGAGRVREFQAVILPGIRNELVVAGLVTVIAAFRVFDIIFVTTAGGPGTSTQVPALQVYEQSFRYSHIGAGAAVGVTLALVISLAVFLITRVTEREE